MKDLPHHNKNHSFLTGTGPKSIEFPYENSSPSILTVMVIR
jgi:hypothetical protein